LPFASKIAEDLTESGIGDTTSEPTNVKEDCSEDELALGKIKLL